VTPPSKPKPRASVFVAYPWKLYTDRTRYKRAYTKHERALGVKFLFAEERLADTHVLDKIQGMIEESAFGIYDVSWWNANVTLEYGLARGLKAKAFIAFNPDKTNREDVPTDVRGYDRLQYADLDQLSEEVKRLVLQELGPNPATAVASKATIREAPRTRGYTLPESPEADEFVRRAVETSRVAIG